MSNDLEFEKEGAVVRIHELHAEVLEALTGEATIQERDTWAPKEAAARAYVAGSAPPPDVLMIETEATLSGQDPTALATYIVFKADQFKLLVGKAAGLRAQGLAAIEACLTPAHVEAAMVNIETQIELEIAAFQAQLAAAQAG